MRALILLCALAGCVNDPSGPQELLLPDQALCPAPKQWVWQPVEIQTDYGPMTIVGLRCQ